MGKEYLRDGERIKLLARFVQFNAQMADFVVATGTALKKKNILNKNCSGNVLPSGPAKKIPIDSAPYVGTLVQEHAALS